MTPHDAMGVYGMSERGKVVWFETRKRWAVRINWKGTRYFFSSYNGMPCFIEKMAEQLLAEIRGEINRGVRFPCASATNYIKSLISAPWNTPSKAVTRWKRASICAILFSISTPALASDPWDTTDKVLFGAGLLSSGADMISTHKFLKGEGHEEWNPVLGERPSDGQLALYWAGLAVIHYLVADYLPNEWYGRKAYLIVVIAAHAAAAHHNTVACEIRW